jgi:hypothetical protein
MRIRVGLVWGLMLLCAGCGGKAIYNDEVPLAKGDIQPITIGPFAKEQAVTVIVSSPGAPVSVYVFESEQLEFVDYAITYGKQPENVLAGEASTEDATLTATVPANKEIIVRLQPAGQHEAKVQLKITQ